MTGRESGSSAASDKAGQAARQLDRGERRRETTIAAQSDPPSITFIALGHRRGVRSFEGEARH